jgi:hypothetical protein
MPTGPTRVLLYSVHYDSTDHHSILNPVKSTIIYHADGSWRNRIPFLGLANLKQEKKISLSLSFNSKNSKGRESWHLRFWLCVETWSAKKNRKERQQGDALVGKKACFAIMRTWVSVPSTQTTATCACNPAWLCMAGQSSLAKASSSVMDA